MFIRDFSAIEDKDGLIFTARGNNNNENIIRCCLIYVPTELPSNRVRKPDKKYFKIPDQTGYGFLSSNMFNKLYTDPITQETYPVVKVNNIVKVIDPIKSLQSILESNEYPQLEEFVSHIESMRIPKQSLGIFGSVMLGFEQNNFHDFDLIVYGIKNKNKYMNSRAKLFSDFGYESVSNSELENITKNIAMKENPIGFNLMHPVSINRQLSCMVRNNDLFSIKFAYLPEETQKPLLFPPKGDIKIEGIVTDDSRAFFMPYTYIVHNSKEEYIIQTYDFAYFSAAFKDQNVKIQGMLRKCPFANLITVQKPYHYISPELK
ncbi:hypothetical protein COS64_03275 [archaeon CG06_land_8_20_14_3_00_37_11]|nr:MAG: hypothetical protein COS64_03275 [archaeon CG06_land_8_20_14_3_00_37_11]